MVNIAHILAIVRVCVIEVALFTVHTKFFLVTSYCLVDTLSTPCDCTVLKIFRRIRGQYIDASDRLIELTATPQFDMPRKFKSSVDLRVDMARRVNKFVRVCTESMYQMYHM